MNALAGWRTYGCAVLLVVGALAYAFGWITRDTFETLTVLLNAGGLAALRKGVRDETAALPKSEPPVTP